MEIRDEIVRLLTTGLPRRRYGELWAAAGVALGRAIEPEKFETALAGLANEKLVRISEGGASTWITYVGPTKTGDPTPADMPQEYSKEASLMPHLESWLRDKFVLNRRGGEPFIVRDTSRAGARSGVWSRPDYTVAQVRAFRYSTLREVELFGFELKRARAGSVIGVHEAYAHTRYVHFAYLVWHVPDEHAEKQLDAVRSECARLGVGLVLFSDPARNDTWKIVQEPEKANPAPHDVDAFIDDRFDPSEKDELIQLLRPA